MYKKNVFILIICLSFAVKGQIRYEEVFVDRQAFPKELTQIVINANVLLAGELLLYKTYNLTTSSTESLLSKIVYVSLRTEKDSVIFNHKLKLKKGVAQGSFFMPATLKTGRYKLLGYTNFSLNNLKDSFVQKNIYVINPYVKAVSFPSAPQEEIDTSKAIKIQRTTIDTLINKRQPVISGIALTTDKSSYKTREKITLNIENLMGESRLGNYVLSVRKTNPLEVLDRDIQAGVNGAQQRQIFHLPELRGEMISGRITPITKTTSIANKIVSLTIPGKDYIFKTAKTNSNGRFFFSINEAYQTSNCIIQINEPDREQYQLVLDNKKLNHPEKTSDIVLQLDSNIKDWLQERSIQLQIENAYFNTDKMGVIEEKIDGPFYGSMGTEYLLDNYTRFPTVKETFVEVVTLARIRKDGGENKFRVSEPVDIKVVTLFKSLDPLLLVDGVLIHDIDALLNYNANTINSIRVITESYRYGPKIYSGVISIKTKKGDFKPKFGGDYIKQMELESPIAVKQYYFPDYSNEYLDRIPDYRNQLFWNPHIELAEKSYVENYYASDVIGNYEILLEGYTKDGIHVIAKQYFTVE